MNISRNPGPLAAVALLTMALSSATTESNPVVGAAAPFVNRANMRDWLADGEHGLWIQASNLTWFYARFSGVCHGLSATNSLVFESGPSGYIGRRSTIVVPGSSRCLVKSFVRSSGPPKNRNATVVPEPQTQ